MINITERVKIEYFQECFYRPYTINNVINTEKLSVTLFKGRLTETNTSVACKLKDTHTLRIESLNGIHVSITKIEFMDVLMSMLKTRAEHLKTPRVFQLYISLSPEVSILEIVPVNDVRHRHEIKIGVCVFNIAPVSKHIGKKDMLLMQLSQIAAEAKKKEMELINEYFSTFDLSAEYSGNLTETSEPPPAEENGPVNVLPIFIVDDDDDLYGTTEYSIWDSLEVEPTRGERGTSNRLVKPSETNGDRIKESIEDVINNRFSSLLIPNTSFFK